MKDETVKNRVMTVFVYVVLLFVGGCAIKGIDRSAEQEVVSAGKQCEIIFEVFPHKAAAILMPDELYPELSKLGWTQWQKLSYNEGAKLAEIFAASPQLSEHLVLGNVSVAQGGYQGETSVSINVPVRVVNGALDKNSLTLASMIGYVYLQDSVLVVCPFEQDSKQLPVLEFTLIDAGSYDYMNVDTARLFYGMMIGYLNDPENVGYTYDATQDTFRVFEFDTKNKPKEKALLYLANNLQSLSSGNIKFKQYLSKVVVYFPHNYWGDNVNGEAYKMNFLQDVQLDKLDHLRKSFLHSLFKLVSSSPDNKAK